MFSADQIFVLGLVSSAIVWLINFGVKRGLDVQLGRGWLTVVLFVVAIPLAWVFDPQVFPMLPLFTGDVGSDAGLIVKYIGDISSLLAQVVGSATAVYNIVLKKVMDGIVS